MYWEQRDGDFLESVWLVRIVRLFSRWHNTLQLVVRLELIPRLVQRAEHSCTDHALLSAGILWYL
jgi:hypothetical protein